MNTRVLLVDDEEGLRRNFRALLEDAGFISAANGSAGQGGTGVFTNDNWGVAVVVTDDANGGFLANYTVTNANAA